MGEGERERRKREIAIILANTYFNKTPQNYVFSRCVTWNGYIGKKHVAYA